MSTNDTARVLELLLIRILDDEKMGERLNIRRHPLFVLAPDPAVGNLTVT